MFWVFPVFLCGNQAGIYVPLCNFLLQAGNKQEAKLKKKENSDSEGYLFIFLYTASVYSSNFTKEKESANNGKQFDTDFL